MPYRKGSAVPEFPPGDPLSGLAKALAPYAWCELDVVPVTSLSVDEGLCWWADVRGILVTPASAPSAASDAGARRALYEQAEAAVTAVEDAGWVLESPPRIEVSGELQWPDGRKAKPVPVATGRLEMTLLPTLRALGTPT